MVDVARALSSLVHVWLTTGREDKAALMLADFVQDVDCVSRGVALADVLEDVECDVGALEVDVSEAEELWLAEALGAA